MLQNDHFMERLAKFVKKIREEEDMFDVTLAAGGVEVRAHKLVISASSPFLRKIIRGSNHPTPYIYLSGVHPQDLNSILNFLYTGETRVEANSIHRFMNSASELQISGLSDEPPVATEEVEDNEEVNSPRAKKKRNREDSFESPEDKSDNAVEGGNSKYLDDQEGWIIQVKEEEIEEEQEENANRTTDDPIYDNDEALEKEIEKRMEKIKDSSGQKLTKCKVCGKTFKHKSKAKFHIETHVEGFRHTCSICGATAKTKKSLSVHIYNRHRKGKPSTNRTDL